MIRVTEVLSFFDKNTYYTEEGRARGTDVHEACRLLDSEDGLDPSSVGLNLMPYIDAWSLFCDKYKPEWLEIENRRDNGLVSGQIDRLGIIHTYHTILDIKTGAKSWKDRLQAGGYYWLWEKVYPVKRGMIIYLTKEGKYKIEIIKLNDLKAAKNEYITLYNAVMILQKVGVK